MKRGLVLGGGGLVGMGYHAGVLKGLEDWGLDVAAADLIVGTSAGSIIGSYLATGWDACDFYAFAHGEHPDSVADPQAQREEVRQIFTPLWTSQAERLRRGLGSFFAVAAARGYWRAGHKGKAPAGFLRKTFPAGMYSTEATLERFRVDLPEEWPDRDLYICTVDLYSGRRVAFGHPDAPPAPLPEAVLASTAIPGVFPPVRIGDRQYVDGGVMSATSLDLAVEAGCTSILCVAPLGYRKEADAPVRDPRSWSPMLVRSLFARSLRREVRDARAKGVDVFVIRPWLDELKGQGTNSMRHYDRKAVTNSAREGTTRLLEAHADHPVLAAFTRRRRRKERAG